MIDLLNKALVKLAGIADDKLDNLVLHACIVGQKKVACVLWYYKSFEQNPLNFKIGTS